jgi:polar amino acid transport system substrate-binding protein
MFPDLLSVAAKRMGLTLHLKQTPFQSILTNIKSHRVPAGIFFQETADREKQVDIVSIDKSTLQFIVKTASSAQGAPRCGARVGVAKGTVEARKLTGTVSRQLCTSEGKKAFQAVTYPDSNSIFVALQSGRIPAIFSGTDNATYRIKQTHGEFKLVGHRFAAGKNGIAISKDSGKLAEDLSNAVNSMIKDGTYQRILKQYGLGHLAIQHSAINSLLKKQQAGH